MPRKFRFESRKVQITSHNLHCVTQAHGDTTPHIVTYNQVWSPFPSFTTSTPSAFFPSHTFSSSFSPPEAGMEDLPAFVVQHILWYSDAQSLVSLLSTSKLLAKAAAEDNLWRNLCKKEYVPLNYPFSNFHSPLSYANTYYASYSENRMLPGTTTFLQSYKMPLVFVSELKVWHKEMDNSLSSLFHSLSIPV